MLYSCADWLTVEDPAPLQGLSTQYDERNDDDAMQQTTHTSFAAPNKKQLSRSLFAPLAPPSPSAVDDLARSPRSFEELQRGSLSLATSIEEFNAIIDADMSGDYYQEVAANEPFPPPRSVPQLFGKLFFAGSSSTARANASTGEIKYGWTPFDDGEFQFASIERDDAHSICR